MNQFTLGNTSKKYTCPQCGHKSFKASLFQGTSDPVDETKYGRCERINSCGYELFPQKDNTLLKHKDFTPRPDPRTIFIMPTTDQIRAVVSYSGESMLHKFIKNFTTIPSEHWEKWGVFSHRYYPDKTVYLFQRITDRRVVNWKIFHYKEDGHRNKNFVSYSLAGPKFYFEKEKEFFDIKYPMCLFGEHLLGAINDDPVIIVESEKTAFISSYYYPDYSWVSCGAANGLTSKSKHKHRVLRGRKCFWLCDADKAGRDNRSIDDLSKSIHGFQTIDLFPEREDGYDIADSILDGYLPNII